MGKTRFTKSQETLDILKKEHGDLLTFDNLKLGIMRFIGADELRTVKPTIQLMLATKLIKQEGSFIKILI